MSCGMGGYGDCQRRPVGDLDGAERAAGRFADRWGLRVGEVMQFDNGFYAELAEPSGKLATEVSSTRPPVRCKLSSARRERRHPDAFPGYYTLHALRGGQVVGMLSVNAATGAVWYHTWHGRFIAINEHHTNTAGGAR